MKKLFLCGLLFIVITSLSFSQNDPQNASLRQRFGVYAGYNYNMHSADFKKLPDCPSCSPGYENGNGSGFGLGLLYEYPISSNSFLLGFRLGYNDYSGTLIKTEPTTVIITGSPLPGEFEHRLKAGLSSINFGPQIIYNPWSSFFVNLGLDLGLVTSKTYNQSETITKPSGITFLDSNGNDSHSRSRNVLSGTIPQANPINLNGIVGASYELPLNRSGSFILAPEVNYRIGFLKVVNSSEVNKWNVNTLSAGIALKYSPLRPTVLIDSVEQHDKIDTLQVLASCNAVSKVINGVPRSKSELIETDKYRITKNYYNRTDTSIVPRKIELTSDLMVIGIDSTGREIPNPEMKIEEFYSSRLQPLLNYIFFDQNSATIDKKYNLLKSGKEISNFNENKLFYHTTLETYYDILNIVGKRMSENPQAKLRIVGCNDGSPSEKSITGLSKNRAESVKNYLFKIWNIPDKNLIVEFVDLPQKASTPITEPDKTQENRRVELYSDDYEILKPVFASDTIRTSNPPTLKFKPEIKPATIVQNYTIEVKQNNKTLKTITQKGTNSLDWALGNDQSAIPRFEQPLEISLMVEDSCNQVTKSKIKTLKISQYTISKKRTDRVANKEIDNYSMILFDFSKADIVGNNKKIMDIVKSRLKPESEILITGYADRTGEAEFNQSLSDKRANAASKILGHKKSTAKGIGNNILIYDNDIPEGRFYCRTVNIRIETPID